MAYYMALAVYLIRFQTQIKYKLRYPGVGISSRCTDTERHYRRRRDYHELYGAYRG
jgi:hypothetical protein